MSIATLFRYLVGSRDAIMRLAANPRSVWLGALFVLSAGFAREYDAHDLWREPWHLLVPLAASLVTSFLLFTLVFTVARRKALAARPFWSTYRPFLALYWLTAPLAWLYAIPVERFLSAPQATAVNLGLLGIVSVWRVALMTRVVSVYFGASVLAAFWLVMLFADSVALVILYFTPLPVFNIMGGIPLTQSEQMIQGAALWVGCLGVPSWFVWLAGVLVIAMMGKNWQVPANSDYQRIQPALWCLASVAVLGWALVLPLTQREQRLRHDVEQELMDGRLGGAVALMSMHDQADFPPHWDPPPHTAYPNPQPPLFDVMDVILDQGAAPWVRAIYIDKLDSILSWWRGWPVSDESQQFDQLLDILERLPEGPSLVSRHAETLSAALEHIDDADRKKRLGALLNAARGAAVEHAPVDAVR